MKRWTNDEIDILKSLNGKSIKKEKLLSLINRSQISIFKKCKKLKIKINVIREDRRTWKDSEILLLKEHYKDKKEELLKLFPNRNWNSLIFKINQLQLSRKNIKWTNKEISFLKENYYNGSKKFLIENLRNRSWDSIILKSNSLKLKRYANDNRYVDLDVLLNESNETYYWIGFIMADGHINNRKRLSIGICKKDLKHLEKFKRYLSYKKELKIRNNIVYLSIMDTINIDKFCDKFDINSRKTYIPCNLKNIKDHNLLLSLIVGFIDGDGSIKNTNHRKDFNLKIKCHKNWFDNLDYFLKFIHTIVGEKLNTSVKLTNDKKYAYICISNSIVIKKLKSLMLDLKIPYMERKWDVIDLNYISRVENKIINKEKVSNLLDKSAKEISNILNIKIDTIYSYIRQLK